MGKRTAQKDITIDTTSDSQVNSNFPNRWSPASLSLPRKSVVRLTDCPDMTLDVYRGRKTTTQQPPTRNPCFQQQVYPVEYNQISKLSFYFNCSVGKPTFKHRRSAQVCLLYSVLYIQLNASTNMRMLIWAFEI